jgi:hypothetical protein
MLDSLMKFGAYRVNYFESLTQQNPNAFGFYIRAEIEKGQAYSHQAKQQLYIGLDLIQRLLGMNNLAGIYVDIDCLNNLMRPAYQQMKRDILTGYFHKILVLDEYTINGCPGAVSDLMSLADLVGELDLMIWQDSKLIETSVGKIASHVVTE